MEAQCGLVLNGQGGVIRRGKAPPSIYCVLLYQRPQTLTARHDKTASRQTNRRNNPLLSAVNVVTEQETASFFSLIYTPVRAQRRRVPFPAWSGLSLNTYGLKKNKNSLEAFSMRSFIYLFMFEKIKMSNENDSDRLARFVHDILTHPVTQLNASF